ncbi:MAG: RsmB/NOP family class I SAM-dependent RNA methyltransferase [Oscillospiraceae bacterium]|nr:nOL1/NOP2/sun family protein [Firmicutes bacterium CAG:137]
MLPPAFLDRVRQQLGPEYEAFLASYHRPRALGLRLNPLKTDRPPILPFTLSPLPWAAYGFWYPSEERPGLHPWHEAGLYYLQEPSAMAPAELLGVEPGLRVLDLCAAPGGKSTQLAAKMRGQGLLVCNEYHPKRAKILSQNVERMAISNALVLQETPERLAKRFPGWFHRVLVDAPCSGEGMFRKEAAALEDWSPELVEMCARRQAGILDAAAELLAPGGRLVYSTCTFAPQEDEGAVAAFLARHPEFEIEVLDVPWFSPGDGAAGPGLEHTFRLWPHKLRGEGHYAAVLRKGAGEAAPPPAFARPDRLPAPWEAFARDLGVQLPAGKALAFGPSWFWAPEELPDLTGLRVLRPGLELGQCRGERFLPAHALALWLSNASRTWSLDPLGPEAARYLAGEELRGSPSGWTLVTVGSLSLGWAKGSGGVLKNHYPKGLRRRTS